MKNLLVICSCLFLAAACHKKSVPEKVEDPKPVVVPKPAAAPTVMVVSDGSGKIYTPQSKLPKGENLKPDYLQLSRGFTPQQKANLTARFGSVPPRVLYVNPKLHEKSQRGTYYIYKKQLWYWKKSDGLFYLDEQYYK